MKKTILAFVGMPGAGKTEAADYLRAKGIPFVRFGEITDEGVREAGLELTPENERMIREKLRRELGMAAYAIKSKPKIESLLQDHDTIGIDGLYSWEEYVLLKKEYPDLTLIHIFAEPPKRYERLSEREIRPVPFEKSRDRDIAELEQLNKGGPISIADYMIENDSDLPSLHTKIDSLAPRLAIRV